MKTSRFQQICTKLLQFGTTISTSTFIALLSMPEIVPIAIAQSWPASNFPAYPSPIISPPNGIWKLQWRMNGNAFDGLLILTSNSGTMTVNVRYANGKSDIIQQRIIVQPSGNGLILSAQNPVYAGTNMPITSYIPNTFLIEQAHNLEGWNAKSCDSTDRCSQVKIRYVNSLYPNSVNY
ncbi:hypothetical protein A0J48_004215 [Sphaerospermopsis aphanizomenoides BCCUSP55]|uniref:hypothetical protein n=1 Tax=Sphaerospermopsis aphanizomenoides TaxID=459663 RepID=UPI00190382B6|nr:hypothetical protein [Sphaerospermopsis aphanizomenoides]MBK1986753.1 hypothetical protein [Sphaerospermopsis aphanizomenoides BCCUSP55]